MDCSMLYGEEEVSEGPHGAAGHEVDVGGVGVRRVCA